ncbi:MAG: putative quinol monooxygenase [Bacillota bacterium]
MIYITAVKYVKKEKQTEFVAMAEELIVNTRLEEGCVSYKLTKSIHDEEVLAFVEVWANRECAIDKHQSTAHFKKCVPMLGELCFKDGHLFVTSDDDSI